MMIKKPPVMRIGVFLLMLTAMSLLVGVGISSLGLHGIPGMVTSGVLSFLMSVVMMRNLFGKQ